jgi:predicted  nucleic acid-binding Zn-ribbon protein
MRTDQEEIDALRETIRKLGLQIGTKNSVISKQINKIEGMKDHILDLEQKMSPMRASLNSMTAERSKWTRKLKRAGVKI